MTSWNTSRLCSRAAVVLAAVAGVAGAGAGPGATVPLYGDWRTYGVSDGLPSEKVFCVLDEGPAVWVGTENGLARIRGEEVETYTEESGLPHRVINSLAVSDRTGDLWIATMGGLARLTGGRIDAFNQLNSGLINDVVYAVTVRGDDVWAATAAGLSVYHTRDGSWELFNHENTLMHEPWCYSLSATPSRLWVGVWGGGVVERDLRSGTWKEYRDPDHEMEIDLFRDDGVIHDVTTGVSYDDGILWVGTYFGLSRYDGRRWRGYLAHDSGLPSNFVNYVWAYGPGVWICTDSGLAYFDGKTWVRYRSGSAPRVHPAGTPPGSGGESVLEVPGSIAHDFVLGVYLRDDVIWVATAAGLSRGRKLEGETAERGHGEPAPGETR